MPRVTQKDKIRQFVSISGSSEYRAKQVLAAHDWDVNRAIDAYFGNTAVQEPLGKQPKLNQDALSKIFDNYRDSEEDDMILVQGTEKLCEDLGLDPTGAPTLVLAYYLKCENMCEFTRKGWIEGWTELECDSLESMKERAAKFGEELEDADTFREVYKFTFNFARTENQKSVQLETAIALWQLLLAERFRHLDMWVEFLREKHNKSITKDTWHLFLDFVDTSKEDYSDHDSDGAWPVLIDSFVVYARQKLGLAPL